MNSTLGSVVPLAMFEKITLSILFIRVTHVVAHVDGKKESMSEKVIFFCLDISK